MGEVILYTTDDGITKIDLQIEDGTVWLSQLELADLFETSKKNISKHIKSIYSDQELSETATVNQKLTVQTEGGRKVAVCNLKSEASPSSFKGSQPNQVELKKATKESRKK